MKWWNSIKQIVLYSIILSLIEPMFLGAGLGIIFILKGAEL